MNIQRFAVATPLLEAGLVIAWSSGFIGGTLASMTSSVFLVMFWRFLLTTVFLMPLALPQLRGMEWHELGLHAVIGSFAMFGYLATLVAAIDLGVPAGTAALVTALQPLATAAVSGVVLGERVVPRQWLGLAVGFGGVTISVAGGLDHAPLGGYALTLGSMACIVIATLIAKSRGSETTPLLPAITIQCAASTGLFLPLAVLSGGLTPEMTPAFGYSVLWLILFSTLAAYSLYWATLARTSATRVSSLIYLTPPVTAVWAFAMLGEPITVPTVVGFLLSLMGVLLAHRSSDERVMVCESAGCRSS